MLTIPKPFFSVLQVVHYTRSLMLGHLDNFELLLYQIMPQWTSYNIHQCALAKLFYEEILLKMELLKYTPRY